MAKFEHIVGGVSLAEGTLSKLASSTVTCSPYTISSTI
jgi:hypothetical protein